MFPEGSLPWEAPDPGPCFPSSTRQGTRGNPPLRSRLETYSSVSLRGHTYTRPRGDFLLPKPMRSALKRRGQPHIHARVEMPQNTALPHPATVPWPQVRLSVAEGWGGGGAWHANPVASSSLRGFTPHPPAPGCHAVRELEVAGRTQRVASLLLATVPYRRQANTQAHMQIE